MDLAPTEARRRFAASPRAVLASVRPDGSPHLVPVVFALVGEVALTAVDHKPKVRRRLQRIVNLEYEPRCALLVDRYDADWDELWWARADGRATVVESAAAAGPGLAALIERYPHYRGRPPAGPYVRIVITRWSGWSADPHGGP